MSRLISSRESLDFPHEHPDPSSSETPPSSPSDTDPPLHHPSRRSRSHHSRRRRPSTTATATATGDESHHHNHHNNNNNNHTSSSSRFLSRLMEREDRDSKKMNNLLLIANERLEGETVRANEAERKAGELIRRFKEVIQGRDAALQDAARVNEELRLYKIQLENAQQEIFKAQETIHRVAKEKDDAEEDAARARTKARQLQEEKLIMIAREEGRRQGFKEGLSRGRRIGFEEGRSVAYDDIGPGMRRMEEFVEDDFDEPEEEPIDVRRRVRSPESRTPVVAPQPMRVPSRARSRVRSPESRTPIVAPQPMRAPSRARSRSNTYDTARHAPTLPVPTIVTPISAPSISRASNPTQRTPIPVPVPAPSQSPESIRPIPESIRPIPVRNSMPSPVPHARVLRDGFIPEADRDSAYIDLPAPHEFNEPLATPMGSEEALPHPGPREDVFGPTVQSRDYAYSRGREPIVTPRPRSTSAVSRGSTRLSQYDLISPPRAPRADSVSRHGGMYTPRSVSNVLDDFNEDGRSRTPQMNVNTRGQRRSDEEVSPTQQIAYDWRSANPDMSSPSVNNHQMMGGGGGGGGGGNNNRAQSPNHLRSPRVSGGPRPFQPPPRPEGAATPTAAQQDTNQSSRSHFRWLLGRRDRGNSNSTPSVPEINIEPPSGSPSNTSPATTTAHPNLLSPEDANRELPLPGDDELNEFLDTHEHHLSPPSHNYGGNFNTSSFAMPNSNPFPLGFVPLTGPTTVMMAPRIQSPKISGNYVAAPLPAGLSYPEPLSRSLTSFELIKPPPPPSKTRSPTGSSRSRTRVLSLGSSSPAPLQRPISLFSDD